MADELQELTGITARETVLGYLLRGGIPSAYDRVLCTRMGHHAVDLVERGDWNRLVVLRNREITSVPLEEATRGTKQVDLEGDVVATARGVGIVFGDENS